MPRRDFGCDEGNPKNQKETPAIAMTGRRQNPLAHGAFCHENTHTMSIDRRNFFKTATASVAALTACLAEDGAPQARRRRHPRRPSRS